MLFIELPVQFISNEESDSIYKYKDLGIDYEPITSMETLYVNPKIIISFNKDSNGLVNLTLPDGSWEIQMKFDEFLELINEV